MLTLLDSGNSHSFVSAQFTQLAGLPTMPMSPHRVKLANGEWIVADKMVKQLEWYCQGHTLVADMIVLDMHPYDAILGFDWLQRHSPMQCDWQLKTLEFKVNGRPMKLQGITPPPLQLTSISATKVYNSTKGNDGWAFVLVDQIPQHQNHSTTSTIIPSPIQHVLTQYANVFSDPQTLPPQRSCDHSIPLLPG